MKIGNFLYIQRNNRGLTFRLDTRAIQMNFNILFKPNAWIVGIQSKTEDGKHAIFLDYDNMFIEDIMSDLEDLQQVFKLFPFMVFVSSLKDEKQGIVNAHAISLSKRGFEEVVEIQKNSHCDWNYRIFNKYRSPYRAWVLRLSPKVVGNEIVKPKPEFAGFVGKLDYWDGKELSYGHYTVLKNLYPEIGKQMSKLESVRWDGFKKVKVNKYRDRVRT